MVYLSGVTSFHLAKISLQVEWSIDPSCISVQYKRNESIRFGVRNIKTIEILEYSELRPEKTE